MAIQYLDDAPPPDTGTHIQYLDDGSAVPLNSPGPLGGDNAQIGQGHPILKNLSKYVMHPLIEGGAMGLAGITGEALAGPETLGMSGPLAAGSIYPLAHAAANDIDQRLGLGTPPTTPRTPMDNLKDFQTGMNMEAGGALLKPAFGLAGKTLFSPVAPVERQAGVKAAQEANIPLTRADITGNKLPSLIESALAKTPTGGGQIQTFQKAQGNSLADYLDSVKSKFGTSETSSASGMTARQGLLNEEAANQAMKNRLYDAVPDVQIPVTNLSSTAQDILQEQGKLPTSSQNPQIIKMASDYLNMGSPGYAGAPPSFQILNKIKSDLGDLAFNGQGTDKMYAARLGNALNQDINSFAANSETPVDAMVGEQFGNSYARARGFYGGMKDLQDTPIYNKLKNASFSDLPSMVFKSGDPQTVLAAKAILGDQGYNAAKKQFFNDIITSPNINKTLSNYDPDFLTTAFNNNELQALQKAGAAKGLLGTAEKIAGNPSGTAQNLNMMATGAGVLEGVKQIPNHPILAPLSLATALGGPYAGSKLYLSNAVRNGIKVPYFPNGDLLARYLGSVANADNPQ